LFHGFTFAESAYSSIEVLSWMSVMVGDPLYRPYASWLQIETAADSSKKDSWKIVPRFRGAEFFERIGAISFSGAADCIARAQLSDA
jgi:hypothetical protein